MCQALACIWETKETWDQAPTLTIKRRKKSINHQICALRGSKGEIIGLRVKKK